MALNFNPSPYLEAFQYGQNRDQQARNAEAQGIQGIGQGIGQLAQIPQQQQELQRQKLMTQLLQGQVNAQGIQNSPLVSPGSQSPNSDQNMGMHAPLPPQEPTGFSGDNSMGPTQMDHVQLWNNHPNLSQFAPGQDQGGQSPQPQPMFSSRPNTMSSVSPQTSDPEAPYRKILTDPTESPIRQKMAAEALKRISEEEKTPYELPGMQADLRLKQAHADYYERMKSQANGVTTNNLNWDSATPEQQRLAEAMVNGNVRPSDLGMRDRATIVTLANEYANSKGKPFQSYSGDVKRGFAESQASGKIGQNALSLNTALGHVDDALNAFQEVGNTNQAWLNKPLNVLRQSTNDPKIIALGLNLNALKGELANVFKNGGATDHEIQSWSNQLNENLTPSQYMAAANKIGELLHSRLNALQYQQSNVMNDSISNRSLISPKGENVMKRISANSSNVHQVQVGEVYNGFRYRGGDRAQQSSWEKVQ